MGKKKHRSRSASRERDRDKRRKRYSSNEDSNSSEDRKRSRHHKSKHKSKDKRRERSRSQERLPTAQELEDIREEERRKKEEIKKYETPEEKRARRLAKKEAKERKRKVQMGWDEEYIGYTNCDNPFGDEHLLETFVWGKKLEHEGISDVDKEQIDKMQKKKMIENKLELEKVKKRRLEREREREDRENEREMLQRNKEIEYYREWEKQEDSFHLNQARLRSKIRIEDGRAKPIDLLARYISAEDEDDVTIEMHEPYTYLNGMTVNDLEDLLEDIKVYKELEQESKNQAYWRDITIITEDELSKLRKLDPNNKDHVGERRTGINQSVSEDVASVFKGKSLQQLSILEESIKNKLKGGEGVDVGYWESLLNQLKAHMARSRLREKHQDQLRRKLFKLKQQQGIEESAPIFPIIKQLKRESRSRSGSPTVSTKPPPGGGTSTRHGGDAEASHSQGAARQDVMSEQGQVVGSSAQQEVAGPSAQQEVAGTSVQQEVVGTSAQQEVAETSVQQEVAGTSGVGNEGPELDDEPVLTQADLEEADPEHQCYRDYESGDYSPRLLRVEDMEIDSLVYDPREDMKRLEFARRQVIRTGQARKDADEDLLKIAKAGMNEEEASFSVMVPLEKQTMIWSDKYRPRKPRFFNRVHTGFEWNKYNQTHYDMDNPPPKIVQGYKFNIFYPDLIDKAKAPTYTITPIEGEADFAVLRFVAGPPYEDIAFKIVNREWEYSYKRGFRCQFQNNIFQLWFHFKRFRYRR